MQADAQCLVYIYSGVAFRNAWQHIVYRTTKHAAQDSIPPFKMAAVSDKIEKSIGEKIEVVEVDTWHSTNAAFANISEKRVMRKIDLHIVPIMTVLYLLSFIDRANIVSSHLFRLLWSIGSYTTAWLETDYAK
jgi:hypothetical protein